MDTQFQITPEYLSECLEYNPETGGLTWKERPCRHFSDGQKTAKHQAAIWNAKHKGRPAFCQVGNHGYKTSALSGKRLTAHRVAWAIFYGEWPLNEIDHINGKRTDNRIANLRDVTRAENSRNIAVSSGRERGIIFYRPTKRWCARIQVSGVPVHLGYHATKEEAIEARRKAEIEHGFHRNHGRAK